MSIARFPNGFKFSLILLVGLGWMHCSSDVETLPFAIRVIDGETKRGIPLVELKTLHAIKYFTDNQGYIAVDEPELLDHRIFFEVNSPGYSYERDRYGKHGITCHLRAGGDTTLTMHRIQAAERLYRITGSGKDVHTQRLGKDNIADSQLKGGVLGQDSNLGLLYQDRILWIWGDSFIPGGYEGNFSVSGAWSTPPSAGGWDPEDGIEFEYIVDDRGFTRPMINLTGEGYVWFDWLMPVTDGDGHDRLAAKYARVNALFGNYERGIALLDENNEVFSKYVEVDSWIPEGHTCQHLIAGTTTGQKFFYETSTFNFRRVKPYLEQVIQPDHYESYTCLEHGEMDISQHSRIDRDKQGNLIYGWKQGTRSVGYQELQQLEKYGLIETGEKLIHTTDVLSGDEVDVGRGSISWNPFRQSWVLIAGSTDIWYGEADTPVGPWVYVTKVASHDHFLYNPVHHPFLDRQGGRHIYFQGTFTKFFSQEPSIPRYEYNQLMYKLDLDRAELIMPVPIYQLHGTADTSRYLTRTLPDHGDEIAQIPFFALDRAGDQNYSLPIFSSPDDHGRLTTSDVPGRMPLFYAVQLGSHLNKLLEGTWNFTLVIPSFKNAGTFTLTLVNNGWQVQSDHTDFEFSDVEVVSRGLKMTLMHRDVTYHLKGTVGIGSIDGTYEKSGTDYQGSWSASKLTPTWWLPHSTQLVTLYESHMPQGQWIYSLIPPRAATASKPFCKVWPNPLEGLWLDFSIKAVPKFVELGE